MQYNTLLTRIAADIYSNGAELITGDVLQNVLNDMVGALASAGACYKGTITPASAAPLDLDQPTVYLALTAGTYTNFVDSNNDPIVTTGPALITYDGGASLVFSKTDLPSGSPDAVLYTPQPLTDAEKAQARTNIGALSAGDLPWSRTIMPDPEENFPVICIWINGGCILAVDSVGDNSFHGVLNISGAMDITAASFVGAGGIDTDVDVKIGYDDSTPERKFVCIEYTQDQPVVITCLAGTAPNIAESGDVSPILDETDSLPWTELGAGGGSSDIFWATYGTTTYNEIAGALADGKMVYVPYSSRIFTLAGIHASRYVFYEATASVIYVVSVGTDNSWSNGATVYEKTSDKVSTISGNETNTTKYPNTKAVADALGKRGVISQTQTWTQAADGGYDYTIAPASIVRGIIPQANIDLFTAAGAEFDTATGYFKLNGLTDISYEEMERIYEHGKAIFPLRRYAYYQAPIRTTLPFISPLVYNYANAVGCGGLFYYNKQIEVIRLTDESSYNNATNIPAASDLGSAFNANQHLRDASYWSCSGSMGYAFDTCVSLERVFIRGLNQSLSIKNSARLSEESLLYMINNAGTATITITLHASVYAKCQSGGEWYSDINTALSAHTNVQLASA